MCFLAWLISACLDSLLRWTRALVANLLNALLCKHLLHRIEHFILQVAERNQTMLYLTQHGLLCAQSALEL